jgi:hypothetical protein
MCARDPIFYIQAAMLLAWADDRDAQTEIMKLDTMDAISKFFRNSLNLIFIIDQKNALEESAFDEIDNDNKKKIAGWLLSCVGRHKYIYSASANCKTYILMKTKVTNELRQHVNGGFNAAEMEQWWQQNSNVDLGSYTRNEVEDLTGRMPLLLNGCVVNGKIDMSADALMNVFSQVRQFMATMEATQNEKLWNM